VSEKEAETKESDGKEGDAPKGGRKKKLIIIVGAAVAVLVVAAVAAVFLLGSGGEDSEARGEAAVEMKGEVKGKDGGGDEGGGGESGGEGDAVTPEDTYRFSDPFIVTLADPKYNRQIQFDLTLELDNPKTKEEIERRIDRYRDAINNEVSARERAELVSLEGKERLKRDLIRRIEGLLEEPGAIRDIYFPNFILP
jgi:flagellar FliL protein